MKILNKLKTTVRLLLKSGPAGFRAKLASVRRRRHEENVYRNWCKANAMTDAVRGEIRRSIAEFKHQPLISIILPVYDVDEKWLRRCLDTVVFQLYENWELCVADDKSPSAHVAEVLREYAAKDKRIKVVFREQNGHISAASNSALELATGEFCVLLDHDDELSEDALFYVAKELNDYPQTQFIYSDEDMIDESGRRFAPKFKPDFSRDLFYSLNLITHLSAYRTETLRSVGGFRIGLEGSQDYDLALRFFDEIGDAGIRHIPRVLYHWRAIQGSVALSADEKPYAHERARLALREHFERTGKKASVERGAYQFHRVRYEMPQPLPKVSLILTLRGGNSAMLQLSTRYENLEVITIAEGKRDETSEEKNRQNFSRVRELNRAAFTAKGEILCFADADLRAESTDWLTELVAYAIQPEIGAVGAMIVGRDGAISEAGAILGFEGLYGSAHRGLAADDDGNFFRLRLPNNFSAVTATCLVVRRELFEKLGGFDVDNLPETLFDLDFCLRLGEKGKRVVFVPQRLDKTSDESRRPGATAAERSFFTTRWRNTIARDPFYNPNLSLTGETFTIATELGNNT